MGCGWLGIEIAKTLKKKGHFVKGSVTNPKNMKKMLRIGIKPYVLNFTPKLADEKAIGDFFKANVLIIAIPLRFKKEHDRYFFILKEIIHYIRLNGIKKVILISTTSVYDGVKSDEVHHIAENYSIKSDSPKVELILKSEKLFTKQQNHIKFIILRVAGLVGKRRNPKNYLAKVSGAGGSERKAANEYVNLVHFRDVVDIIVRLIAKNLFTNEIYNVVSDKKFLKQDFYQQIAAKFHYPFVGLSKKKSFRKVILNDKVKKKLNYRFRYKDILKKIIH